MLKLMNKLYHKDQVTIDIINAIKIKMEQAEDSINDLYKQIFLNYATWYLGLKENEMGITKRSESYLQRRNAIRTRLLGVGTATKELIEGTVNAIEGIKISVTLKDMSVVVNFLKVESNEARDLAKSTLAEIIPYHLDLMLVFEHIKWKEPKQITWAKMKTFTWGEITDSVEGSLLVN